MTRSGAFLLLLKRVSPYTQNPGLYLRESILLVPTSPDFNLCLQIALLQRPARTS